LAISVDAVERRAAWQLSGPLGAEIEVLEILGEGGRQRGSRDAGGIGDDNLGLGTGVGNSEEGREEEGDGDELHGC
jgi:hypothetical protein